MRLLDKIFLGLLILACFSSCEMREEILGNNEEVKESGLLTLNIVANAPKLTKASVETSDFNVSIIGIGEQLKNYVQNFKRVADLPESIVLPVGNFEVHSSSGSKLEKRMDVPFYAGNSNLTITKNVRTTATVKCKMQNSKILLRYSPEFLLTFNSWSITLDDGSETVLPFEYNGSGDLEEKSVFWYFGEKGAESITLNIRATTTEGNLVTFSQVYYKKNAENGYTEGENPNFIGGDALTINLKPGKPEDPLSGKVTNLDVTVSVLFENTDEEVKIEVQDKDDKDPNGDNTPNVPVTPQSGDIIISEPNGTHYLETGVVYNTNNLAPSDVELKMDFKNGLKNVFVKIESTHAEFLGLVQGMGLVDGDGLDLTSESAQELGALFPLPKEGETTYSFALSETLFGLMKSFNGEHKFTLKVKDSVGNEVVKMLSVKIEN